MMLFANDNLYVYIDCMYMWDSSRRYNLVYHMPVPDLQRASYLIGVMHYKSYRILSSLQQFQRINDLYQ